MSFYQTEDKRNDKSRTERARGVDEHVGKLRRSAADKALMVFVEDGVQKRKRYGYQEK